MDLLTVLGLAVGLSMDAFAVALAVGFGLGTVTGRQTFRLAFHFGLFQLGMPVLGWLAGLTVAHLISGVDHWVAFGLLAFIGAKMVWGGLRGRAETSRSDPTRGVSLVVLSLATSIDALAVGLSLAMMGTSIAYPAIVIGVVTAALTAFGLHLGRSAGARLGSRMELLGGIVLLAMGIRILVEHAAG